MGDWYGKRGWLKIETNVITNTHITAPDGMEIWISQSKQIQTIRYKLSNGCEYFHTKLKGAAPYAFMKTGNLKTWPEFWYERMIDRKKRRIENGN